MITRRSKRSLLFVAIFAICLTSFAPSAVARGNEFDAVCDHIEEKYRGKKVKIPFMWLARAFVGVVRPAGVKAFKVTIYRELRFDDIRKLNDEMKITMRDSFSEEWSPLLRMRSRNGENIYMNMREAGKNVKILLVSIKEDEAVVVRAKFNPDKLVKFLENPKIFGISLSERKAKNDSEKELTPDKADKAKPVESSELREGN